MKYWTRLLALIVAIQVSPWPIFASSFEGVYADYQEAVKIAQSAERGSANATHKWHSAAQLAEQALIIGQDSFDPLSENLLNLQANLAYTSLKATLAKKSVEAQRSWLETYQRRGGDMLSPEIAQAYVNLMDVSIKLDKFGAARSYLDKALRVINHSADTDPTPLYSIVFQSARKFVHGGDFNRGIKLLDQLERGVTLENTINHAQIDFLKSQAYSSQRKLAVAKEYANSALEKYLSSNDGSVLGEAVLRAQIVRLAQKMNDSSVADEQISAIEQLRPWQQSKEAIAIYVVQPTPVVSVSKWQKQSKITYSFDVNENGLVENIEVVRNNSSSKFALRAKEALQSFYFLPKYSDGQPVSSTKTWDSVNGNSHQAYCDDTRSSHFLLFHC